MIMLVKKRFVFSTLALMSIASLPGYAATPVDLSHQNASILQSFIASSSIVEKGNDLQKLRQEMDSKQQLHVRMQQTYQGYPVWGADAILHIPGATDKQSSLADLVLSATRNQNSSMNGTFYQKLNVDLANAPEGIFSKAKAEKVLQEAIQNYSHTVGTNGLEIKNENSALVVYVDIDNKAHWAYKVSFDVAPNKTTGMPAKPVYIMDALSSKIYRQWDNIQTDFALSDKQCGEQLAELHGGGFGGNKKSGEYVYDGLPGNRSTFLVQRDCKSKTCFWQNATTSEFNANNKQLLSYSCALRNPDHNNVYWSGNADAVNGASSPANDGIHAASTSNEIYKKYVGVPVLSNSDGSQMILKLNLHVNMNNAYWDGAQTFYGDGDANTFYPFVTPDVVAHEFAHGFTQQHSNLTYSAQSGGMNESYSDISAAAEEFYSTGKSTWLIGGILFKTSNRPIRYMDQPSKDCFGRTPGNSCSIDNASQYYNGLGVHYSSGVYNRFFYFLSTTSGWDPLKAFQLVAKANRFYWTSSETFASGACGVIKAAVDDCIDEIPIIKAFAQVGVDASACPALTVKKK
jgi:pseudolysin